MIKLPSITPNITPNTFLEDEDGAAAIEYAVLIALIIAAVIAIIAVLGTQIRNAFQSFSEELTTLGISS